MPKVCPACNGQIQEAKVSPFENLALFDLTAPAIHPYRCVRMSLINLAHLPQVDAIDSGITRRRGNSPEFGAGKGAFFLLFQATTNKAPYR